MKSAPRLAAICLYVAVLLLSGSLVGCHASRTALSPPAPIPSLSSQQTQSRAIQGFAISLQDSVSAVPSVEFIFHQISPDSLARSWRALTQEDGSFHLVLPAGSRYRVEISCEARYVATAEVALRAVDADSNAVRRIFYVPCRAPEPIHEPAPRLYFAAGQATLSPKAVQTLRKVQRTLQANASLAVRLEGHAATQEVTPGHPASKQYLLRLGQRRAQAAYDYLLQTGIPANRLSVRSFGSQRPLIPDSVADAILFNPRVEFQAMAEAPAAKGLPLRSPAVPSRKPATPARTRTKTQF